MSNAVICVNMKSTVFFNFKRAVFFSYVVYVDEAELNTEMCTDEEKHLEFKKSAYCLAVCS
jgi:hypothetical protein